MNFKYFDIFYCWVTGLHAFISRYSFLEWWTKTFQICEKDSVGATNNCHNFGLIIFNVSM